MKDLVNRIAEMITADPDVFVEKTLNAASRKRISKNKFGIPEKAPGSGSYPMPDIQHARNALSRVAQHGSPEEKKRVRAKAHELYPSLKDED